MSYRSCRRRYVDEALTVLTWDWSGRVIDIGGERVNQRGRFHLKRSLDCLIVNVDSSSKPDLVADAESLPLADGLFDYFLLTEVLEHVPRPERVLSEASRVLKSGGEGVISMPFLVGIHGDPGDFQRWTLSGLEVALTEAGFELVSIRWNGGLLSVVADMTVSRLISLKRAKRIGFILALLTMSLTRIVMWIEKCSRSENSQPKFYTGWTALVRKM